MSDEISPSSTLIETTPSEVGNPRSSKSSDDAHRAQEALCLELVRIANTDDQHLRDQVAAMAAAWLIDGRDALRGADGERLTEAIRARLGEPVGEAAYLALLRRILAEGALRTDRTGTGTYSLFGASMRFDLRQGFPLITTKRVVISSVVRELLWFLRGQTNIRDLGCRIWDEWADEQGDVGPVYGYQWRRWGAGTIRGVASRVDAGTGAVTHELDRSPGIDQITQALDLIKHHPDSRRILVSAWNVADLPRMRLPACHLLFQFYVDQGCLDCQMYQRSADMALGVPFNIASYALLLAMFAQECRLTARHLTIVLGDAHIYANHVAGIQEQLSRKPLAPPRLVLADKPVLAQTFEDIRVEDYQHHPAIRFEVSV